MGTSLRYDFNSYKILDQDEALLRANGNPFSVVVLTTLLAIVNKNISDEALKDIKHDLYEEMMKRKMDKKTRQGLYDYHYLNFSFNGNDAIMKADRYHVYRLCQPVQHQSG